MTRESKRQRMSVANLGSYAQKKHKMSDADKASHASSSSTQSERAPITPPNTTPSQAAEDAMARLQERQRRALEIYNSMKRTFAEITQPTDFAAGASSPIQSPIAAQPAHDGFPPAGASGYQSPPGYQNRQADIGSPATVSSIRPPSAETAR